MPTQVRWADGDELAHREAAQLPAEIGVPEPAAARRATTQSWSSGSPRTSMSG